MLWILYNFYQQFGSQMSKYMNQRNLSPLFPQTCSRASSKKSNQSQLVANGKLDESAKQVWIREGLSGIIIICTLPDWALNLADPGEEEC